MNAVTDTHMGPILSNQEFSREDIADILAAIAEYHPNDNLALVEKAYLYAAEAHRGQMRKSGEPYIIHPIAVAGTLAGLMLDATTVAAGFLHDCVEDNDGICREDIEREFGAEVALLVDGVTKLNRLDFTSKEEQQAETLRKMFLAMGKDIRVVLIKLADRLHNMRTLKFQKPERQKPIAKETLDIYAPLCHRLGLFTIKPELEDLSLRYIDPESYQQLREMVGQKFKERKEVVDLIVQTLREALEKEGIKCDVNGRPKHFYSIYRKMKTQGKSFEQIHDLFAVRVIVESLKDCYAALGVVHMLFMQVPNRFKDYISMPKGNMYRSLHTTVLGQTGELRGQTFEVQIRTKEMHQTAEYGIAAHWRYKEGRQIDKLDDKLYWLRQLLDWQNETRDSEEFMNALKTDLFSDEIFVFTPKGDIINLPKGATPIDFAYRIHSAVGNRCVGARVNQHIVKLDEELNTGDFVEIMTSSSSKGPSRDWLTICQTSEAKSKIRTFFKKEFREENLERGREMLELEAKRQNFILGHLARNEYLEPVYRRYSLHSLDDLCIAVGVGALSSGQVVNRLIDEYRKNHHIEVMPEIKPQPRPQSRLQGKEEKTREYSSHGIVVEDSEDVDMPVRTARCCTPLPGDDIVGFITRGRGISVHRRDCTNMKSLLTEPERFRAVHWAQSVQESYEVSLSIVACDRTGLLADISHMLAQQQVPIIEIAARANQKSTSITTTIRLVVQINGVKKFDDIVSRLRKLSDVLEVIRTGNG